MAAGPTRCLFCDHSLHPRGGRGKAKTDEHVIPLWLQRHLGVKDHVVMPTRVRSEDRQILDMRQHFMASFVCGGICYDCNHGWMAHLENDVRRVLLRLIENPQLLETLTPEERLVVARWTLKTAVVLNRCSSYGTADDGIGRRVPEEHMRMLAVGGLPADTLVVGAGCKSTKFIDFMQYALWTNPKNSIPLEQKHRESSYKIGFSFRDLILIAAYYPSADYAYGINTHHYVPLWTGHRKVVPVNHLMDDSAPKSISLHLEGLLRNISVMSLTWLKLVENVAFTRLIAS